MSKDLKPINDGARFGLSDPEDLLEKLHFDIERLRIAEAESRAKEVIYAVMDCAVTIVAIKDWTNEYRERMRLSPINFHEKIPLFDIANEIANGMKHYVVKNKHAKERGFFSSSAFIRFSGGRPVKVPHFTIVGWDDETLSPREIFLEIAIRISGLLTEE